MSLFIVGPLPRDIAARLLMSPVYESPPPSPAFREPIYSAVNPITISGTAVLPSYDFLFSYSYSYDHDFLVIVSLVSLTL